MIKAETIIHEGNPGPNWLDHCRTVITPFTVTLFIILSAILITVIAETHHQAGVANNLPASSNSHQPTLKAGSLLKVAPLTSAGSSSATSSIIQSASGGSASDSVAANSSASALGAPSTPSLNTANTSSGASNNSSANSSQLGGGLTKTVQTTVQGAQNSVNKVVNGLKLGGL